MSGIQRSHPVLARRCLTAATGCLALAFGWHATLAFANPTPPIVASGSASFQTVSKTLTVTNTPGAIINWQSFSIDQGATTRFTQQSAASTVLNRVLGQDPSLILGTLSSNGRVFLIMASGTSSSPSVRVVPVTGLAPQIPLPSNGPVPVPVPHSVGPGSNVLQLGQSTFRQHPVSLNLAKREASF